MLGQRKCIAAGEATDISPGVQPSRRSTADCPEISPPSGTDRAVRTPELRATGISSLSGLTLVRLRTFGLIAPDSSMSTVDRTAPISANPRTVFALINPG